MSGAEAPDVPTDARLPVTVIGGYLGTGKTTLVNHLLRHADGRRLAVLVNEFGELPIDADLIEAAEDDVIALAGGCVCCSYGNDLASAFATLRERGREPDHVLVEASGVALPGAIASTLGLVPGLSRESTVVLADAETLGARATDRYVGDTLTRQLASADLVLLNRCDLAGDEALDSARATIRNAAPRALVVEVEHARVPPEALLDGVPGTVPGNLSGGDERARIVHPRFASAVLRSDRRVDINALVDWLTSDGTGVVRAKGVVRDIDDALRQVQVAGGRATVATAPRDAAPGLVVIGLRPLFHPAMLDKYATPTIG